MTEEEKDVCIAMSMREIARLESRVSELDREVVSLARTNDMLSTILNNNGIKP